MGINKMGINKIEKVQRFFENRGIEITISADIQATVKSHMFDEIHSAKFTYAEYGLRKFLIYKSGSSNTMAIYDGKTFSVINSLMRDDFCPNSRLLDGEPGWDRADYCSWFHEHNQKLKEEIEAAGFTADDQTAGPGFPFLPEELYEIDRIISFQVK